METGSAEARKPASCRCCRSCDLGWNVVNVDYRLLNVAPAPASAEDCLCALRWSYQHAKDYNIDTNRLVLSGNSAGGHLSLLVGMAPASAGFDTQCPGRERSQGRRGHQLVRFPEPDRICSTAPTARPAVNNWIGNGPNRMELAKRLSPIDLRSRRRSSGPDDPR